MYVADKDNHRIQVFTPEGWYLGMIGSKGAGPGELCKPAGVAIDGNQVCIAEYTNHTAIKCLLI